MDYPMAMSFVLGALVLAAAALIWLAARARRRAAVTSSAVLIGRAMERQGITPADAEAAGLEAEIPPATRRCAECTTTEQCRSWLQAGWHGRLPASCPNRTFFDDIQSHQRVCNEPTER